MRINVKSGWAVVLLLAGVRIAAATSDWSQIEKTAETYRRAALAGDATAIAATYREDAVEMPPFRQALTGRAAIEQYYRELFAASGKVTEFGFSFRQTAAEGDIGYTTGTYKRTALAGSNDPVQDSGNFVVIVKRTAGVWKSAFVIYNSDRAPVPPGIAGAPLISPFAAIAHYYRSLAWRSLMNLGWLLAIFAAIGFIAAVARRITLRLQAVIRDQLRSANPPRPL